MALSITLPHKIQEQVQQIANQKGEKVENVVIAAIAHYVAHEQPAQAASEVSSALEQSRKLYQEFKARLRQRYPSLQDLPREEVVRIMDDLSAKASAGWTMTTWQEAEAFMRGEAGYDFARQQYLHH